VSGWLQGMAVPKQGSKMMVEMTSIALQPLGQAAHSDHHTQEVQR
jgi:hypothetical protein